MEDTELLQSCGAGTNLNMTKAHQFTAITGATYPTPISFLDIFHYGFKENRTPRTVAFSHWS